ncbi:transposable element Tcb1 transposase [Trichonephila clavipes]|nr:transposable element Tcb1 transposase [Trichonephila clavipes]
MLHPDCVLATLKFPHICVISPCISAGGIGRLHIIDGKLNVKKDTDTILDPKDLPSISNNASFIFQQDSASYHTVKENAKANAFWVSVRKNISKRWNTTENIVSKNQSSADSAIRLSNTSILNSNAADITEYFLVVPNYIILNIL